MNKLTFALCAAVLAIRADSAAAQTPVPTEPGLFAGGTIIADVKRFSSDQSGLPLDGNAVGGEARVGTYLTTRWSLEFDFGTSRTTTSSQSLVQVPVASPASNGNAIIPEQIRSTVTNRPVTASAVVGYHPSPWGRVGLGYLGGFTFLHLTHELQSVAASGSTGSSLAPGSAVPMVPQIQEQTDNLPAAVVGIEAHIKLDDHWALVPEFRATAFGSSNGVPGGFFLRPGLGFSWSR